MHESDQFAPQIPPNWWQKRVHGARYVVLHQTIIAPRSHALRGNAYQVCRSRVAPRSHALRGNAYQVCRSRVAPRSHALRGNAY